MRRKGITRKGIESVFDYDNHGARHFVYEDFMYVIAYSKDRKIIHVAYRRSKSIKFDIELLQVELPDEEDIKKYWCQG